MRLGTAGTSFISTNQKPMYRYLFIVFALITFISCDEKIEIQCLSGDEKVSRVETNPIEDLPWLKAKTDYLLNHPYYKDKFLVVQGQARRSVVFTINIFAPLYCGGGAWFDCSGTYLSGIGSHDVTHKKVIFNSGCSEGAVISSLN